MIPTAVISRRIIFTAGILVAIIAVAAVALLWERAQDDSPTGLSKTTAPIELRFTDAAGNERSLADFRGKALVVNLWATWCVPCRKEMPTLDRLQATLGGADFQVVTLSVDRGGAAVVTRFFANIGVTNLPVYLADMAAVKSSVGLFGLPTTILVDRDGREVSRLVGPAEWDSLEMVADIRRQLDLPESSR